MCIPWKKRQKMHEHIGRRRGTEQATSCDPAHKASYGQGRDIAVQTLPLHAASALAGHSSLPLLLGNCFRESSCALNRTSTYWLALLQGKYWCNLNKTAFIRSDGGRNMGFFPLFPQWVSLAVTQCSVPSPSFTHPQQHHNFILWPPQEFPQPLLGSGSCPGKPQHHVHPCPKAEL